MIERLDCAPNPHIEWLLSISINRLQELERGFTLGTFLDLFRLRFLNNQIRWISKVGQFHHGSFSFIPVRSLVSLLNL
jgi:hypothetical protein